MRMFGSVCAAPLMFATSTSRGPINAAERLRLTPGMMLPVCHDALGRALLAMETDRDVYGIVRRANAEEGARVVSVEGFMEELRAERKNGYAECAGYGSGRERVLAIPLCAPLGFRRRLGSGSRLSGFQPNAGIC